MEVISGMEVISQLAPRPSTPVPNNPNMKKRNNNPRGSMSAPSSPARSAAGGASSFFPLINRLPSQDSMDRSIHNESTHGKSSTQIIRELKQANASLSAKTATMEADFMNQLNLQNRKAEEKQRRLEETLKHREKVLANLETRCQNAEQTLQEREDQLTKLREDSAFQRHTISDLKNQLYQLEQEREDEDYDQRDSVDKWQVEKQEMIQEMEDLRAQVQDSQVLQQEVDRLNHKLEEMKVFQVPSGIGGGGDNDDDSQMGSSQRSSYTNRSFMKQNLPQTRDILKQTKHRLKVTEAALDILKQERVNMMQEHQAEVEELQQQMEAVEETHCEREEVLKKTIRHLEQNPDNSRDLMNSSIDGDSPSVSSVAEAVEGINQKTKLEEANQTMDDLREQVRKYSLQVSELTAKLEKVKADAESQEQYRADEAEDLRVLHDAQEEEIERLRKELDYVNRELELRDQELEEQKLALENELKKAREAEKAAEEEKKEEEEEDNTAEQQAGEDGAATSSTEHDSVYVTNLKQRLEDTQAALERLENQMDTTQKEHHDRVEHLETVLHQITEEKEEAEEQLAQLSAVLVNPVEQQSRSMQDAQGGDADVAELPKDCTKAADLSVMLRRVEELQEKERKATARVQELELVEKELEELRNFRQTETKELEELVVRLKQSEEKLASTRDGAMEEYRAEIQNLRAQLKAKNSPDPQDDGGTENKALAEEYEAKLKCMEEEGQELQEELNTVKREKEEIIESHMKTLRDLEESKAGLEEDYEARLEARDTEVAQLKQRLESADEDKTELQQQLEEIQEAKQALIDTHEERLQQLKDEMQNIEDDFTEQLEAKQSEIAKLTANQSSAGEPTSDSDLNQIAMLKEEVAQLQNQLLEEQVQEQERQAVLEESAEHAFQSGGAMESDLRLQLKATKRSEQELQTALENLTRENEEESRSLKEKLEDRDTTISVLVKSSRGLEQRISELEEELHSLRSRKNGHYGGHYNDYDDEDEELEDLRDALADYKEVESRLLQELSLTKKQLNFAESEIARLQEVVDDEISCGDYQHYRRQIQERDDAVSALVQQSMSQESENHKLQQRIRSLTSELESLRSEKHGSTGQLRQELRRLQQESEIFAGQIIEQDEELEALRAEIHSRDERIASLDRQLAIARGPNYKPGMANPNGESPEVVSLKAAIDELEEANETYRDELRDLRVKARDYERVKDELARLRVDLEEYERKAAQASEAETELKEAIAAKEEAEQRLAELQNSREDDSHVSELLAKERKERNAVVSQRDKVIEDLRRNIDGSSTQIEALETEIDILHKEIKQKSEDLENSTEKIAKLEAQLSDKSRTMLNPDGEKDNINRESNALFEEVEDLQQQVKELEEENQKLSEFKEKMVEVEAIQEQSKKLSETYERKLSLLALDKDATIDSLRKSLMDIKGQASDDFEAMTRDLKKMERENKLLREEMEGILEEKNNQIFALEHTLDAQEQLVGNMKAEMDHLQGSMENNVYSRREEIEDMQKEVLDLTARNASYEREITSLKMQLEESKLLHMSETAKLRDQVERLEYQAKPSSRESERAPPVESFPIHEVKERLEKLRLRNNSIQEENFKLKSRLEKAEKELQSARNDKYRTATLEAKVGALTKQLERLEMENKASEKRAARAATANAQDSSKESKGIVGSILPSSKTSAPQSPPRNASRPSSRSGTPLRSLLPKSRQGTPQRQRQVPDQQNGSKPASRQSTPQRKRTPLRPRHGSEQTAPDTPGGRSTGSKRSFFGFRKKGEHSDDSSFISLRSQKSQAKAKKKILVPPSPSAPNSDKSLNAPSSSKSLQSAH